MIRHTVAVVLPALNEAGCVESVVRDFVREGARVVVVDNGSTDETGKTAERAGAEVVYETRRGYGSACLAGLSHLTSQPPGIVVFADCDGTLDPQDIHNLIKPIESGNADLVLGRRARVEHGAMPISQTFGNALTCFLLRVLYGLAIRDIPPYRAGRWSFLERLKLSEKTYGFPIETVALAARMCGRVEEVDVAYRVRAWGESKVAGSLSTAVQAGMTMIALVIALRFRKRPF